MDGDGIVVQVGDFIDPVLNGGCAFDVIVDNDNSHAGFLSERVHDAANSEHKN